MDKKTIKAFSSLIRKYIDYDRYHISYNDLSELGLDDIMKNLGFCNDLIQDFWDDLSEESTFYLSSLISINILNMPNLNDLDKIYYITKLFYAYEDLEEWINENNLMPKDKPYIEWHKKQVKELDNNYIYNFFKKIF